MALSWCKIRGIIPNNDENFSCVNCLHSLRSKTKLESHENVFKNYDYCYIEMPKKGKIILKYNYGENSVKIVFIIYTDIESLLERIDTCHSNPKSSSKVKKHTACGYLLLMHCSFDTTKSKHDYYRVEYCMKSFFKRLNLQWKTHL